MSRRKKKRVHPDSETARRAVLDANINRAFHRVENLVVQRAADLAPSPVQWLWPDRIARGQLTLVAGDAGVGKSLLAIDLAARVSSGARWPGRPEEEQEPGNVLIITAHDDPAAVGRARLEKAGADLSRVFFVSGPPRDPNRDSKKEGLAPATRQINLADDVMSLLKLILLHRPIKLVVIDPAWIFCARGSGRSRNAGPAILAELANIAAQTQVALVCLTDLRRDGHAAEGYRAVGEKALLAAAPTEWGLIRDEQEPERRMMLSLKSNGGPRQPGLAFTIQDGRIVWEPQTLKITGKAALAAERSQGETTRADDWLSAFLAGGPRKQTDVVQEGSECGLTESRLRRSKESLKAVSKKVGFDDGTHWVWMSAEVWQALREKREAAGLRAEEDELTPEILAAGEEFAGACGERVEGREEKGEETRGRLGDEERGRTGDANGAHIFEEGAPSSSDFGGFCEDGAMAGVTSSEEDTEHLRGVLLGLAAGAMELESGIWDREQPLLPLLTKGGSEAADAGKNGVREESHIFAEGAPSSSDLGGFCEDGELAGAAFSDGDSEHLRELEPFGAGVNSPPSSVSS